MKRSVFYLEVSSLLLVDPSLPFSASSCLCQQSTKQNSGSSYYLSLFAFLCFLLLDSFQYTNNPFLRFHLSLWGIRAFAKLEASFRHIKVIIYAKPHLFIILISGISSLASSATTFWPLHVSPSRYSNLQQLFDSIIPAVLTFLQIFSQQIGLISCHLQVVSGIHNAAAHTIPLTLASRSTWLVLVSSPKRTVQPSFLNSSLRSPRSCGR
ncbi:hypothetical protein F4825DRAFT_89719 [Nemania diffusa]|nr:hypothetical protein F4825DRAFT_89719 [Nemania diffusa]